MSVCGFPVYALRYQHADPAFVKAVNIYMSESEITVTTIRDSRHFGVQLHFQVGRSHVVSLTANHHAVEVSKFQNFTALKLVKLQC